ncbi:uncharacterized protein METZ01_LOCUS377548 [marine metagenome]|uniref:Uncharacterized protein n=1 Tax=marine metagenome TaxID=408172 RepID=A0A382TRI2_9ZZZZ
MTCRVIADLTFKEGEISKNLIANMNR